MFRHILVPLDGSRLAESALPMAATFARRFDASVTLLHMIEKDAPSEVHRERHLVSAEEAAAYLEEVSRLSTLAGLRVQTHVHESVVSDVAGSVTEHATELSPDLVVMSTHGFGGARRFLYGTLAQQVIARGRTPVLVVRPSHADSARADWRTILAPTDGDPGHERCLPVAADLARAFACRLHLMMVVPTVAKLTGLPAALSMMMPAATRLKLEMDSAGARDYLGAKQKEMEAAGIRADCETVRGDPARSIVKVARRLSTDLIVMGTHGRTGTDAFWAGSVAAQVIARSRAPLLLVPLRQPS
ncbi:MAG TPA: universal stress protein [Spirochaetia bacterium]|nr:universal stress protein [Spirochaetia bacterium]